VEGHLSKERGGKRAFVQRGKQDFWHFEAETRGGKISFGKAESGNEKLDPKPKESWGIRKERSFKPFSCEARRKKGEEKGRVTVNLREGFSASKAES